MTPLRPVKFSKQCEQQLEKAIKTDKFIAKELLFETHNYLSRMTRPYELYKKQGIRIIPINTGDLKNYFNYTRGGFRISFDFEASHDGYLIVNKLYTKGLDGKYTAL